MPRCFVPGCPNTPRNTLGLEKIVSFHKVPKSSQREWLVAIGRDPTIHISNNVVCSDHFNEDDFYEKHQRRTLKPGVIPSQNFSSRPLEIGSPRGSPNNDFFMEPSCSAEVQGRKRKRRLMDESTSGSTSSKTDIENKTLHCSSSPSSATSSVKRRFVRTFHNYSIPPDVENLKQRNRVLTNRVKLLTSKLKTVQKTSAKRKMKIKTMSQIIHEVHRKYSLSTEATSALEASVSGIPLALMRRIILNSKAKGKKRVVKQKFPAELKSFAMTLQFYSTKAYNFVRETFNLALPAPATISRWMSKVDCSPGFSKPSIETLRKKSEDFKSQYNKTLLCALILDEMSIKKELVSERHTQKIWGYTDIGTEIEISNEQELATEALVLMVVSINDCFKIPIAYFFVYKISGEEKANIILEALRQLNQTACKIVSITCDGPTVHFKMMESLGCQITNITNIKNYFLHPVTKEKVFVIFDICHMLKLVRNNWAISEIILDPQGNEIRWDFIEKLHNYQMNENLTLANKLKNKHLQWKSVKMKVDVAAQTLSSSVADALLFLSETLHLEEFENVQPTVKFIRIIDQLFDLLNSRNIHAKGMKMPMKKENSVDWKPFITEALNYLRQCKTKTGVLLYKTKKRTPIIGFVVSAQSILDIYEAEVMKQENLNYLLTYKFSQDHLELFFCSVRSRNGWVNNPNCLQFMHTYRRLLLHRIQRDSSGNCIAQDQTYVLVWNSNSENVTVSDVHEDRKTQKLNTQIDEIESTINLFLPTFLNEYSENVVAYISGFVVRKLESKLKCSKCIRALYLEEFDELDSTMQFVDFKNKGGLIYSSRSVRQICNKIEKKIQLISKLSGDNLPMNDNFIKILLKESRYFMEHHNLFNCLDDHVFDYSVEDVSHKKILIEQIIRTYGSLRIHSTIGRINEMVKGKNIRQIFSKLILFKNQ